ncbi:MAG: hypothetical protein K9N49_04865 [Candidatus Marinimicrobia bacterium]|nr:hypothetical protein [Candidatus Neomarinimicrobiota bacterium]
MKPFDRARRVWAGLCLGSVLAGLAAAEVPAPAHAGLEALIFDWGWLGSRQVEPGEVVRTRWLGPLFETTLLPDGSSVRARLRPVFSGAQWPAAARREWEVLWPVARGRAQDDERRARVLLAWYSDYDGTDPAARWHLHVLPLYFQGRGRNGQNYLALFPFGGVIRDFLWLEEIRFALFPLWVQSAKNDLRTTTLLWPVFSRTDGEGVWRRRVFPLWGRSIREGQFDKQFILWPFWNQARYDWPESHGRAWILFPLAGRVSLSDQQSIMVLPPFFRWHTGVQRRQLYCPWPFVQWSRGDIDKLYFWPLWGRKRVGPRHSGFVAWPLASYSRATYGDTTTLDRRLAPFYYERIVSVSNAASGRIERPSQQVKLWPLGSYRRHNNQRRWRVLDLWPLHDTGPVERAWAPLWTLYQYQVAGSTNRTDLLWGLFKQARVGQDLRYAALFPIYDWQKDHEMKDHTRWNLARGLLGYERQGRRRTYRFLWGLRWRTGPGEAAP